MVKRPVRRFEPDDRPGPAEFRDPLVREEIRKAAVWFGMAWHVAGGIFLAQALQRITGGVEGLLPRRPLGEGKLHEQQHHRAKDSDQEWAAEPADCDAQRRLRRRLLVAGRADL